MEIKNILGDYDKFFDIVLANLNRLGISVSGYPMSHLGYKAKSIDEYEYIRDTLLPYSISMVENVHNGRQIAKILLMEPLVLHHDYNVSLMEIMPPKNSQAQKDGLEHCGFVVGNRLTDFENTYSNVLTGKQDQGPYCQPAFIVFDDGTRVKFYEFGLKEVVELEGRQFLPLNKLS